MNPWTDSRWHLDLTELILALRRRWWQFLVIFAVVFAAAMLFFRLLLPQRIPAPKLQIEWRLEQVMPRGLLAKIAAELRAASWPPGVTYSEVYNDTYVAYAKVAWTGPVSESNQGEKILEESRRVARRGAASAILHEYVIGPLPGFYLETTTTLAKRIQLQKEELETLERFVARNPGLPAVAPGSYQRQNPQVAFPTGEYSNGLYYFRSWDAIFTARRAELDELERRHAMALDYERRVEWMARLQAFLSTNQITQALSFPASIQSGLEPALATAAVMSVRYAQEPYLTCLSNRASLVSPIPSPAKGSALQALLLAFVLALLAVLFPEWVDFIRRAKNQQAGAPRE